MISLQSRLRAGIVVALLVTFGLQYLLVTVAVRRITEDYVETRLARDIDAVLAALTFDAAGVPRLARVPDGHFDEGPYSGRYYQVQVGAVTLRSQSLWDQALPIEPVEPGASARERIAGPNDQPLLMLRRGFAKDGRELAIEVAEDMSAVDAGLRRFQAWYFAVSGAFLLVLVLLQQWIVRGSLAPLANARIDLEKVTRGDAERLGENVPLEIRPLVREINALLVLLSRRLARSRTLAGNLAHGLKTPLSLLVQLGADDALQIDPAARRRFQEQLAQMRAQVERELNRARLAGDGRGGRRFNPAVDLPPLLTTLEQLYFEKDPLIEVRGSESASWAVDREDALELLGNLADNACKWCRRRVRITLGDGRIHVEDDGPGGDLAGQIESGSRGERLDEAMPGHGLGLSIVHDIVQHYGGRLCFARSVDLGGLDVQVDLRATPAG
jgi:signal transduction histidine kinase